VTTPRATTRHDKDATYTDVLQLHCEWTDACLTSSTPLHHNGISTLQTGAAGDKDATHDSHCGQWVARSNNECASVALITSGSATQGPASTTLDMEMTPGTR
jgi:hypothetical protein